MGDEGISIGEVVVVLDDVVVEMFEPSSEGCGEVAGVSEDGFESCIVVAGDCDVDTNGVGCTSIGVSE